MMENRERLQPGIPCDEQSELAGQGFQFRCDAWPHATCLNEYEFILTGFSIPSELNGGKQTFLTH